MRRWIKQSLYYELIIKLGVFLILPFCLFSVIIFGRMLEKSKMNHQLTRDVVQDYAQSVRQKHINNIISISNRIDLNHSFKGFLLNDYTYEEWIYYSNEVTRIVTGGLYYENLYIPKIYFQNQTIPRGFNVFYYLSDIQSDSSINAFLESDETEKWVVPVEGAEYKVGKAFTPFANHYTYMKKIYVGEKFLYLLTVSIADQKMNEFLISSDGEGNNQIIRDKDYFIINTTKVQLEDRANMLESLQEIKRKGYIVDEIGFDSLTQKLIYVWNPDIENRYLMYGVIGFMVFLSVSITVNIKFIRYIFQNIFLLLRDFGDSVNSGKYEKLEVAGRGEIAQVGETINSLIDKVHELIILSNQQSIMVKESQLRALQHQINPHFIYNTLEVFSYKMELYEHIEEADAITSFSKMLRYNTSFKNGYATIREEVEQVENYMKIQKLKYSDVVFRVVMDEKLFEMEVLRFIFQPLVENSFAHGYCNRPLLIEMICKDCGSDVWFEIKDNGSGITQEKLDIMNEGLLEESNSEEGIGLNNINRRLQLFYSNSYHLQLTSKLGEWTVIAFKIPK